MNSRQTPEEGDSPESHVSTPVEKGPEAANTPASLESSLAKAMQSQADGFEPSPDAYVRIQQRVASIDSNSNVGFRLAPAVMAIAAALLLVVGIVGYLTFDEDEQLVVADGGLEQAEESAAESSPVPESGSPDESDLSDQAVFPVVSGNIASSKAATPTDAAVDFLSLIRVQYANVYQQGSDVVVIGRDEAGVETKQIAVLRIAIWNDSTGEARFVVTAADTSGIDMNDLPTGRITDKTVVASGSGTATKTKANVGLYSSNDGLLLEGFETTLGGSKANLEFDIEISLAGRDHGWVVLQKDSESDAVGKSMGAFSARPVFFDAPLNDDEYRVSHIAANDAAGGLVVRHLPGPEELEQDVLPAGTSGIHRRGQVASSGPDGEGGWWAIDYGDSKHGWVNSRYLSLLGDVSEAELVSVGQEFLLLTTDPLVAPNPALWPIPGHKPVQVGWIQGLKDVSSLELGDPAWWSDESQLWSIDPASGEESQSASLRSFMGLLPDDEVVVLETFPSPYGNDLTAASSSFSGLASVTIKREVVDGPFPRSVTLYVEPSEKGPVIVGIALWIWSP